MREARPVTHRNWRAFDLAWAREGWVDWAVFEWGGEPGWERRTGGTRLCATCPQCQENVKVTVTCTIWLAETGMEGVAPVNANWLKASPVGKPLGVLEVTPRHWLGPA